MNTHTKNDVRRGADERPRHGHRQKPKPAALPEKPRTPRPPEPEVPYWVPDGDFWDVMSEGVKRAVASVLGPAYQKLVAQAPDELERSAGITLVHLMWLEICDQLRLGVTLAHRDSLASKLEKPEEMIAQHLHLVAAKNATSELLVKLRAVRAMIERAGQAADACTDALPLPVTSAPVLPDGPSGEGGEERIVPREADCLTT